MTRRHFTISNVTEMGDSLITLTINEYLNTFLSCIDRHNTTTQHKRYSPEKTKRGKRNGSKTDGKDDQVE